MSDPLGRYRQGQQPASQSSTGQKTYEAYDKSGKVCPYTEILCVSKPSQAPQTRFFMAAVFSADFDEAITLLYSFMAVEIKGKHLKDVRQAIQNGRCAFIQEFNADKFSPPAEGTPMIESIRFIAGEKLGDILSAHNAGK